LWFAKATQQLPRKPPLRFFRRTVQYGPIMSVDATSAVVEKVRVADLGRYQVKVG
jgi:hypothetical protein